VERSASGKRSPKREFRILRYLAALALLLVLGSCDGGCLGIGPCETPTVRYEGLIEKAYPGGPAPGVEVVFIRTGGVSLESDSISARTNEQGRFRLEIGATQTGEVRGDLLIYPPVSGSQPTRSPVRIEAVRTPGDITFLGKWAVPYPHLPYEASFFYRATNQPAVGIEVEFRRTGGIAVEPDTFRTTTDAWGNVKIRPLTRVSGEVRGELVVFPLPPHRSFTIPDLRMRTFTTGRADSLFVRMGIGSLLPYAAVVVWETNGQAVAGAEIEFVRTGGVPVQPNPYRTVTDAFGTFLLTPIPLAEGEVVGRLTITPPAPWRARVIENFRLQTTQHEGGLLHMGFISIPRVRQSQPSGE
jgi:hypothetical protein